MSARRVLITCPQLQHTFEAHRRLFEDRSIEVDLPPVVQQLNERDMLAIIGRYDGAILGDDVLSARVLERAVRLRVVSKWGIGMDNIDVPAAAERGVIVTNTPGVFEGEVADVVIGYLVMLARRLHVTDRHAHDGEWSKIEGASLAGRRLGVIGLGSIGRAVARRALAMDMVVLGHDVDPGRGRALAQWVSSRASSMS